MTSRGRDSDIKIMGPMSSIGDRLSFLSSQLSELQTSLENAAPVDLGFISNIAAQTRLAQDPRVLSQFQEYETLSEQIMAMKAQLQSCTLAVERRRDELRFSLSPLYLVPSEVLRLIFRYCARPEILALVSKEWRTLAIEDSGIWTNIELHWPRPLIDAYIERAKSRPIQASLPIIEYERLVGVSKIDDLPVLSKRFSSLSIRSPAHRAYIVEIQRFMDCYDMQELEWLYFSLIPYSETTNEGPFTILLPTALSPPMKLRQLYIYFINVPNLAQFTSNLVELSIYQAYFTITQWFHILESSPRLEIIHLFDEPVLIDDRELLNSRKYVTMPELRVLFLQPVESRSMNLLSTLELFTNHTWMPKLDHFSITQVFDQFSRIECSRLLSDLFDKAPSITKLNIYTDGSLWDEFSRVVFRDIIAVRHGRLMGRPLNILPSLEDIRIRQVSRARGQDVIPLDWSDCLSVLNGILGLRLDGESKKLRKVVLSDNCGTRYIEEFRKIASEVKIESSVEIPQF